MMILSGLFILECRVRRPSIITGVHASARIHACVQTAPWIKFGTWSSYGLTGTEPNRLRRSCKAAIHRSTVADVRRARRHWDLIVIVSQLRSAEFFGESEEKSLRSAEVAEPIRVFILDDFANELRAERAEPCQRLVNVVHGEHDAEVAKSVHRGLAAIRDGRRRRGA
jgi:hypothetical protein